MVLVLVLISSPLEAKRVSVPLSAPTPAFSPSAATSASPPYPAPPASASPRSLHRTSGFGGVSGKAAF
ncbi:hypothetical protein E2C01_046099 [Portunus trituberculatus]|uniref:Uncharacterized protein n=1 Tax=Portunus trituberculatus TaxID=210409 RepID=A0A5B7G3G8_PORTR|nr:hypothetical protein [Portunus trituberculatus]